MRIATIALLLAFVLPLCAQIDNGNITGRVTDPSGAAVVGAQVTLTQTEMNFVSKATTNEEGIYRALSLRPGPYRIEVVAQGFKKLVRESVELRVNSTLAVNAPLEVGAVTDSVQVSAAAQLLETETSATGATLAGDYFYNLPNYQRHASAVLFFTPGVQFASNAYVKSIPSINGIGSSGVGYFEDGVQATMGGRGDNAESIDNSIEDIKVFTSAMPAEYGHTAGVGISIVKKSGTNAFHGVLSEQFRTRSMQHRRYFEEYRNSQQQPGFTINPPGLLVQNPDGNVSGPVYIPKIYDGRNKTFFFYGTQWMIEKQGKQLSATVPTAGMLAGDFSCSRVNGQASTAKPVGGATCDAGGFAGSGVAPNQLFDPTTTRQVGTQWFRDPIPGNIITPDRWSKVARTFLGFNAIGPPNVAGLWSATGPSNNVQMGPQKITKWQNHTARIDHQVSTAVKLYASYTYNHEWGRQPPLAIKDPRFDSTLNIGYTDRHTGSVGATWVVSPTMVNDFRANYFARFTSTSSMVRDQDYASLLGMGGMGLPKTCMPGVIPTGNSAFMVDQNNSGNLTPGCGSNSVQENYTLKDDLSKSKGAHNFKAGIEFLRYHQNSPASPGNVDGTFGYANTNNITTTGGSVSNTGGINLANFMLGAMSNFSFGYNTNSLYTRSYQISMYVQDDWKVTPNLTLNYGLRYNVEPPKHYKYGIMSLFDLTLADNSVYSNGAYLPFCPAGGCTGAFTHPTNADPFPTDWKRFDPTIGLAWHFMPKMVLRMGGRISHSDTFTDNTSLIYNDELTGNSTGTISQQTGNYRPLFMLDQGIPSYSYPALRADGSSIYTQTNVGSRNVTIVQQGNFKTPYTATWNIGIQRELSRDYMLELRYEGSAGVKQFGTMDINARPRGIIPSPNHDGTFLDLTNAGATCMGISCFNYRYAFTSGAITTANGYGYNYATQYARPYPNLGAVNIVGNYGHSDHQSGIVRLEKRFSKGLNFTATYTYQKNLDGGAMNMYQSTWYLDKAQSGQRHNFTATMNYEVPVGKGRHFLNHANRLVDAVLGGYNIMWTYTLASGNYAGFGGVNNVTVLQNSVGGTDPKNPSVGVPNYPGYMPGFGSVIYSKVPQLRDNWQDLGTDRWNQADRNAIGLGGQHSMIGNCGVAVVNYGNDCFTFVPTYGVGNNAGNLFTQQRIIAASAAISKEVPLKGERTRLQLRLDLQNPFKWFNWGGPSMSLDVRNQSTIDNSNTFGTINPNNNGETGTGTAGFGGTPLLNMVVAIRW